MAYKRTRKMGFGTAMFFAAVLALTGYFVFAAIQGDYGHLRRIQVEAEERRLTDIILDVLFLWLSIIILVQY